MTEEQTTYETPNVPVRQGARDLAVSERGALMIRSYMELMQMAALYHKSGMAPGSLDTIEKVAIGMATCLEIGVPIVTGLQHVAVINGRASIWGDLVMSIVQGSGLLEEFEEKETGTPFTDDWFFTCHIKRKGRAPAVGKFSWAEAKRAGLSDPKRKGGDQPDNFSPWRRFPRRMMMWAARRWVIRDQFADVLKGIVMAEDALDTIEMGKGLDGTYRAPAAPAATGNAEQEKPKGKPVYEVKDVPAEPKASNVGHPNEYGHPAGYPEGGIVTDAQPQGEVAQQTTPAPPTVTEAPKAEPEKTEPLPSADPWAREKWIDIRKAGFSTYFYKNRLAFATAPTVVKVEALSKWQKLYPDTPFPETVKATPSESLSEPQPESPPLPTEQPPHGSAQKFDALVNDLFKPEMRQSIELFVADKATHMQKTPASVRSDAVLNFKQFCGEFRSWYDVIHQPPRNQPKEQLEQPEEQPKGLLLGMFSETIDPQRSGEQTMSIRSVISRAELIWPDICKQISENIGLTGQSIKMMRDADQAYAAAYEYLAAIIGLGIKKQRNPDNLKPSNGKQRTLADVPTGKPKEEDVQF